MIIPRFLESHLLRLSKSYPVVTITGPRQAGKTTLAKKTFPSKPYVNLEAPDLREFAGTDPRGFLKQYPAGAILDEIQNVPELVSYIQVMVDEINEDGLFILTGSEQLRISNSISQSLAGRTAILRLLPFALEELAANDSFDMTLFALDDVLYQGFYPRIVSKSLKPTEVMRDYVETYIERDVRRLGNIANLSLFQKFLGLCAGRIGQILNLSSLANDVGISPTTARSWMSILEASYIVFLLPPYFANISKRLIKSPKLYFYDVGLASYLLKIKQTSDLALHPLRGSLFENLIIMESLKAYYNRALAENLYFYRDSNGTEIDLLLGQDYRPVEIKSAATFSPNFLRAIKKTQELFPSKNGPAGAEAAEAEPSSVVVYGGDYSTLRGDTEVLSWRDWPVKLEGWL